MFTVHCSLFTNLMLNKIIFFGTSEFAVPCLKALSEDKRFEIFGVVTQPDRPVGRHAILTPPPVKIAAQELGLKNIFQPEKLKELTSSFSSHDKTESETQDTGHRTQDHAFAAFVVVAYGKILPSWLLDIPKHGVINVHPSLLPRWRGPSPIQAAITAGDRETGVTIMKLDADMDHGPLLAQEKAKIDEKDDGESLHDRLADLGAKMLPTVLDDYLAGKIQPKEQTHAQATFCKILTREDGELNFTKTSTELERQIRAFNPWPGCWTMMSGKRLKILKSIIGPTNESCEPGQIFDLQSRPHLSCANGSTLELTEVQPESGKPMSGEAWFRGVKKTLGL